VQAGCRGRAGQVGDAGVWIEEGFLLGEEGPRTL